MQDSDFALPILTTLDTFEVQGRGVAHVVRVPKPGDSKTWLNTVVILDGVSAQIVGVEWPETRGCTSILVKSVKWNL